MQEPEARGYLDHIASELREEGIAVETDVSSTLFGTVPQVLVGKAAQRGCELIVMSTHGRSGLGRGCHRAQRGAWRRCLRVLGH